MAVGVPNGLRRAAKRLLPDTAVEYLRSTVLRNYLVGSVISKEGRSARFLRRTFTRRRPTLFHLDVHVTDHCNLNCRGCEHYSSISEPVFIDLERTVHDLERLADLLEGIEEIYLIGGEPLLHPRLEEFVRETRRVFPATRLYVMTNGILVMRMPDSFWEAMHEANATLLCDRYPIKLDHASIDERGREHGVAIEWMNPVDTFFKIPIDVTATCDPRRSFAQCRGLTNCAQVRNGRLYPCARIAYVDILAEKFGEQGLLPGDGDSIAIEGQASGDEIIDFLMTPVPWCAHCDFDSFERFRWSQGSGERSEWF